MESEIKSKKLDRVVLDSKSIESVKNITDQIEAELGDFVQTNPKLIINFLLQNRCEPLSKEELEKLKSENYDLVKALKRATEEAIKAKQNGSQINFNDVLKIIQTPSVKSEVAPKKARGRKRKSDLLRETTVENSHHINDMVTAKHSSVVNSELDITDSKNDISPSTSILNSP